MPQAKIAEELQIDRMLVAKILSQRAMVKVVPDI
jgi:hypothetical protein